MNPNHQHDESWELQAWNYHTVSRTIVAAASSLLFGTLWELVKSVKYWEPRDRLVLYTCDTSRRTESETLLIGQILVFADLFTLDILHGTIYKTQGTRCALRTHINDDYV